MRIKLRNCLLHFNDLFVPKVIGKKGEPAYSATFIIDDETEVIYENDKGKKVKKPALVTIPLICERVTKEKWGKKQAKLKNWAWNKADGSTTREQYVNQDGDYYDGIDEDTWFVSAKKNLSRAKDGVIPVVDQHKQAIENDYGIYAGCRVVAIVDIYAFDNDEGNGLSASLEVVQLLKKGEKLSLGAAGVNLDEDLDEEEMDEDEVNAEEGDEESDGL